MASSKSAAPERSSAVQALTTNDASTLALGQVQYSLLCIPTAAS